MEFKVLQPESILVPGEYNIGNELILKIYFRIFNEKSSPCLPPVIITPTEDFMNIKKELNSFILNKGIGSLKKDVQTLFSRFQEVPYILMDGNHRVIAATLNHYPINTLEMKTDDDIKKIKEMVEIGELFSFKREERDMNTLRGAFIAHCLYLNYEDRGSFSLRQNTNPKLKYLKTIKDRVEELISNKNLPEYMTKRYLEG